MNRAARTLAALVLVLGLSLTTGAGVHAGALDDAKAAGWLGERIDGYVGVVDPATPDNVKALAQEINAKRRAKYQGVADAEGTSLEAVEVIIGQKLIERARPGEYVMDASGRWVRK